MPFKYEEYREEVEEMNDYKIAEEKKAYTRKASGHATGYVTSLFLLPFLGPFALVGTATATVAATNAGIKLDIINDEMRRRDKYKSTRARDVFGGAAISLATAGFGHGVSHVAHHAITHATHHVVTHGQHLICDGVGDASEHGAEYGIDTASEKGADLQMLSSVRYLCDMCYEVILKPILLIYVDKALTLTSRSTSGGGIVNNVLILAIATPAMTNGGTST
jgi:hypothetical protein